MAFKHNSHANSSMPFKTYVLWPLNTTATQTHACSLNLCTMPLNLMGSHRCTELFGKLLTTGALRRRRCRRRRCRPCLLVQRRVRFAVDRGCLCRRRLRRCRLRRRLLRRCR